MDLLRIAAALVLLGGCRRPAEVPDPPEVRGGPVEEATKGTEVLVVRAEIVARTTLASAELQRVVAVRKGVLQLPSRGGTLVTLRVHEVLDGEAPGTTIEVVFIDEAAHGDPGDDYFGGRWRLRKLPNGLYVADAIEDTPFPAASVARRREIHDRLVADLASEDLLRRYYALRVAAHYRFVDLVPRLIELLHVEDVPRPPPWYPTPVPLGEHALEVLRHTVAPIATPETPSIRDAELWRTWWRRVLETAATAPRPTLVVERVASIDSVAELFVDPRGSRVLTEPGVGGFFAGGIAVLDVDARTSAWVRRPPGRRGPYDHLIAAAWRDSEAAVAWSTSGPGVGITIVPTSGPLEHTRWNDVDLDSVALAARGTREPTRHVARAETRTLAVSADRTLARVWFHRRGELLRADVPWSEPARDSER